MTAPRSGPNVNDLAGRLASWQPVTTYAEGSRL
jgi:hypothetical protein